jgi:hypothetical protein
MMLTKFKWHLWNSLRFKPQEIEYNDGYLGGHYNLIFAVTTLKQVRKLQRPGTHVCTTCWEWSRIQVERGGSVTYFLPTRWDTIVQVWCIITTVRTVPRLTDRHWIRWDIFSAEFLQRKRKYMGKQQLEKWRATCKSGFPSVQKCSCN